VVPSLHWVVWLGGVQVQCRSLAGGVSLIGVGFSASSSGGGGSFTGGGGSLPGVVSMYL